MTSKAKLHKQNHAGYNLPWQISGFNAARLKKTDFFLDVGKGLRKRLSVSVLYFGGKMKSFCIVSGTQLLFQWFSGLP